MNRIVITFLLSTFFPAAFCLPGATTKAVTPNQIDPSLVEGADKYLQFVLAGNASAVAAMYLDDAVLMPADCPLLRGRPAIEQYYREWFKGPARVTAFTFTHLESPVLGDTAFDVGTYRQTLSLGGDTTVNLSGKYSVILKRVGAEWKIAYLIFNSDSPSKTPPTVSGNR
jgi:ketosteroid isomerase-like protein